VSITSPPRPPRPPRPVDLDELEALVEALIEEARQRARRRRRRRGGVVLLVVLAGAGVYFGLGRGGGGTAPLAAPGPNGAAAGGARTANRVWEPTHGPGGGPAYVVAVAPSAPNDVYAGTEGGVFRSTNGGRSWARAGLALPRSPFAGDGGTGVTALVVDPRSPKTVYAAVKGAYPGGVGGGTAWRDTLYKTTDGGRNWRALGVHGQPVAISPTAPPTVYVDTDDSAAGPSGLARSTDGGRTWRQTNLAAPSTYPFLSALAFDPSTPTTVYAAVGHGVSKSTDNGSTWQTVGVAAKYGEMTAIAVDPRHPQTVYAGADAGLIESLDAGRSWRMLNATMGGHGRDRWYGRLTALHISTSDSQTLYASTVCAGVFKSTDGGHRWRPANAGLQPRCADSYSLALDPRAPQVMYAAERERGVLKSLDGGAHWQIANQGLSLSSVTALAVDAEKPQTVYASTRAVGLFKSTDGGASWQGLSPRHKLVQSAALNPSDPRNVLMSAGNGIVRSTDGGRTWRAATLAKKPVSVVAISGKTAYAGTAGDGLFGSTDGGHTWRRLGPPRARVQALAVDPADPAVVYAGAYSFAGTNGSASRGLYKSIDSGHSWRLLTRALNIDASAVALDPENPATVYVGTAADEGGVFKSTDGGATWVAESSGLKWRVQVRNANGTTGQITVTVGVNALAIDPGHRATLYAGTGGGVYTSTDAGKSWRTLNTGLSVHDVRALALDAGTLYAGTWGGGVVSLRVAAP
jgi:photosystem II stability/assembly factor-like uncharacterized protein